jgi:2-hydroxychromene-2-carboxylate isomerase
LFEQQRALFSAMQQGNAQGQFQTIARTAGFTDEEFRACMTNQDILEAVEDANDQAVRDGIGAPLLSSSTVRCLTPSPAPMARSTP